MFELMGRTHNSIDGTYCFGMLQYEGLEYGSRGQICTYRCMMCGREIRNLEEQRGFGAVGYGGDDDEDESCGNPFGGGFGGFGNFGGFGF